MKIKNRKRKSRFRGSHTHGRGAKKKARGSGHRGGIGKAGSGKRADHKKIMITKEGKKYFGKSKTRRAAIKKEIKTMTLEQIKSNVEKFVSKKSGDVYEFDFKNYKIIGNSDLKFKAMIHAKTASKGAIESVRKAGGEIVIEKDAKEKGKVEKTKEEYDSSNESN